jgi:hypothetical protein
MNDIERIDEELSELRSEVERLRLRLDALVQGTPDPFDRLPTLLRPITALELTVRSANCLESAGIELVGELCQLPMGELLKIPRLGRKSAKEIDDVLRALFWRACPETPGILISGSSLGVALTEREQTQIAGRSGQFRKLPGATGEMLYCRTCRRIMPRNSRGCPEHRVDRRLRYAPDVGTMAPRDGRPARRR